MCGIVGFVGGKNAVDVLIAGLHRLEYRGYDSVGIATMAPDSIEIVKTVGKVKMIEPITKRIQESNPTMGIGHTRWATHGEASEVNSHPHHSNNLVIVHNGIIENYAELRTWLTSEGYTFQSDTDTEVAAHLLDYLYATTHDAVIAMKRSMDYMQGAYAIAMMVKDQKETLYAFRCGSPLVIGVQGTDYYLGSDITAFESYTQQFIELEEGQIAEMGSEGFQKYDQDLNIVPYTVKQKLEQTENVEMGDYPHFMLKEIHEQPEIIQRILDYYTIDGKINLPISTAFETIKRIHIIACGTALHAGYLGKYWIEQSTNFDVLVHVASEFRYQRNRLDSKDIFVFISQSGETADTLASLRFVKEQGLQTVAIVNNEHSSLAKESAITLFTKAGIEQSVASTKAYSAQAMVLLLLSKQLSKTDERAAIQQIPELIIKSIDQMKNIMALSEKLVSIQNAFYIGRGVDYYLALEGSLKLKEITYIHSEAIQAGELKHGSIALIDENVVTVALVTQPNLTEKSLSNIHEIIARGGKVIVIAPEDFDIPTMDSLDVLRIPTVDPNLTPFLAMIPLQLLAYHTSVLRGCDVDQPRNLAKSVTVE
ncbi:glutamine--fructose-6-phosphate transaminase (isomerizing) [Erysipelothrix sp. HDW6C]|uniref:glutamine--fructose-6-phosphate transaminase (isomerizing) n=1 Tax=Erysipelothrix sp. HDW6C TaxID=2714930 RepID=UPI001408C5FE|nr:glutamine--fructose-6-phosphate transaminase (isomerizing) [Erysipelothrix sp. HDW6C]QIK68811.1 glutamine--fructose-6-phosphate transaminase (isomerizing) [Erysipelothrix sp. HDW6C]